MTPRVLFVARTRYGLPLTAALARRFDALGRVVDWRVFGTSASGRAVDEARFRLVPRFPVRALDGVAFYAALPFRLVRELRRHRPDVVVVQGAADAALLLLARRLAGVPARVVFDVHGDWRHDTRQYGARARRLLTPVGDLLARIAVRRADGVRTVSPYTSGLVRAEGVEPAAEFPAYMDLEPFTRAAPRPAPAVPTALFVGVLERYKGVDVLVEAWEAVAQRLPDARLEVVGRGPLRGAVVDLARRRPGVRLTEQLGTEEVAAALDAATALVLPSRYEGMGRVVVEAFCRGRPVVGTAAGGIADLVEDGVSGLLVPVDDSAALADALVAVLGDPGLAARLGAGAHAAAPRWSATADEWAARTRELVDRVAARR